MNLQEQTQALIAAHALADEGLAPILELLRDTSLPLDDRWTAYTALVESNTLINNDGYGDGFVNTLGDLSLYDDFNIERHQTMTFSSLYEKIMEADAYYEKSLVEARNKTLSLWQEEVLASGKSAFTNDW